MRAARPALYVVLLLFIGMFTSCVRSENPLSDETTSTLDKRLLGRWRQAEEGAPVLRVEAVKGSKHRLQAIEEKEDAGLPWDVLATTLGGQHFLSLGLTDKESGKKMYFICRYEFVDDDTLKAVGASSAGNSMLKQLVETKKLKGKVEKVKYGNEPVKEALLSESTDSLRGFLAKHWRDIFSETKTNVQIYKRQK